MMPEESCGEEKKKKKSSASVAAGMENHLVRAREALRMGLEESRRLRDALDGSGARLRAIRERLPSLQEAMAPLRSHDESAIRELSSRIDQAVVPTVSAFETFLSIRRLEQALLVCPIDAGGRLADYIALTTHLEAALRSLPERRDAAVVGLEWVTESLSQTPAVLDTNRVRRILQCLTATCRPNGNSLDMALHNLADEFHNRLSQASHPRALPASLPSNPNPNSNPDPALLIPAETIEELQSIVSRLASTSHLDRCLDSYLEIRLCIVEASMESLHLDYLHLSDEAVVAGDMLDWKLFETHIGPWTQHIEVIMKLVFELEFHLLSRVFEKLGPEVTNACFERLAEGSGFTELLHFGEAAAMQGWNEPQKLFKLLDMFEAVTNLRPMFVKIFGGCREVQRKTRDLLRHLVRSACKILLELKQQVELQRDAPLPTGASVPSVSVFVLRYFRHLAGDFYSPIISQVLAIEQSWRGVNGNDGGSGDGLFAKAVQGTLQSLELNLQSWANRYDDLLVSHLFLASNHWYLYKAGAGLELGRILGETWVREQLRQSERHMSLYARDGWGKITQQHLDIESALALTHSRSAARDLLRIRLRAFNVAFDELCQRHGSWRALGLPLSLLLPDAELREKVCTKAMKAAVPAYRTYIQSYGPLMEQDGSPSKYIKYSAQGLERVVRSLFFQSAPEKIPNAPEKLASALSTPPAITRTAMAVKV